MMKTVLVCTIVALVAIAAGIPQEIAVPRLDGKILGGREVTIEDLPHQISLQLKGGHICGGSIISDKFILTAAHCTARATPAVLSIRAGSTKYASGGQKLNIKNIIVHPDYRRATLDYDISILELDGSLELNDAVKPIQLADLDEDIPEGTNATCSGWGDTSEGGSMSKILKAVDLAVIGHEHCQALYKNNKITARMLCAGGRKGEDSCQGDSGGPLVANNQLIGVVSWGKGCGREGYPGIYASVQNLRNYIKENTGI